MTAPKADRRLIVFAVRMQVEVDTAAWNDEYGPEDLGRDVESYIINQLAESSAAEAGALRVTAYAFHESALSPVCRKCGSDVEEDSEDRTTCFACQGAPTL